LLEGTHAIAAQARFSIMDTPAIASAAVRNALDDTGPFGCQPKMAILIFEQGVDIKLTINIDA
jgi:hypothetical protein